jgi:SAM-dependent methyltransferase
MKIGRTFWALQSRIAPGLTSSQCVYRDVLLSHLARRPRWLDLGCGHQFLPNWAWTPHPELLHSIPRLVGVDADLESIKQHAFLKHKVLSNIGRLPFAPESFDLVTANMVMEHVANPMPVLEEVSRVLRPDGLFLFHTPNVASPAVFLAAHTPERVKRWLVRALEGRSESDIYPTAYRINTRSKVAEFGGVAGFTLEGCKLTTSAPITAALGPFALFELLWIRLTYRSLFEGLRPNIIAVLRKGSKEQQSAATVSSRAAVV